MKILMFLLSLVKFDEAETFYFDSYIGKKKNLMNDEA
jgi:hypothetical protein